MRIVVAIFLILIVLSLFSALYYLYRDRGQGGTRVVKALALRVGLSITLFLILMGGYYFGLFGQRL
jgi:hypothetical protein